MKHLFQPGVNTIYLDMDGVLADFDKYLIEHMGRTFPHSNGPSDRAMWDFLSKVDRLYAQLEPTPYCMELVELARHLSPKVEILTAIPRRTTMSTAEEDKIAWAAKYIDSDIKVNIGPFSRDKWKHAKPGDILVDDRADNIRDWINQGFGIGIFHVYDEYFKTAQTLSKVANEYLHA